MPESRATFGDTVVTRGAARRAWWIAAGAYAAVLAAASLLPSGEGRLGGWDAAVSPGVQNLLHVPAYALLAVLVSMAVRRVTLARLASVAVGCAAFGAALEFAQAAIPGRFGSLGDVVSNTAGACLGTACLWLWSRFEPGRASGSSPV